MSQRDPEWFAARAGRFTASRFADLMATTKSGPSTSRKNLIVQIAIERITGTTEDSYTNAAMQRGIDLEPEARMMYELTTGNIVEEVDFIQHPSLSFVGVSPDGLIGDDGMMEIKCPSAMSKHLEALRNGAHAVEYKWQIQGQLWVSCRKWNDAVSYDPRFPEGKRLAIKRVWRDEKMIEQLEAECIAANEEVEQIVKELS
jgi:putative phage-type endonuclease